MENYKYTTWDNRFSCRPKLYFQPSTRDELKEIVRRARETKCRVKVRGSGHSQNRIACTDGFMIDLSKFDKVIDVNIEKKTVRVEAGITLHHLSEDVLPQHGLALSVISVISDQSLAGAISTCTHGTGFQYQMMASYIIDLDIMTSSGEEVRCSREVKPELFSAACCGLGALGIIMSATIQCEEAFNLHEKLTPMKFDQMAANLVEYAKSGDHVSFVWMPSTDDAVMLCANRTKQPVAPSPAGKPSWFWQTCVGYYIFQTLYRISDYYQGIVPWINWAFYKLFMSRPMERVDASHRVFVIDIPTQVPTEWAVPIEKASDVLRQLKVHADAGRLYAHSSAIRFVKADDIMLSPSYKRDVCYINLVNNIPFGNRSANLSTWTVYNDVVGRAEGIPHWAKNVTPLGSCVYKTSFPLWERFCEIREEMDPGGMFLNEFLEKCIDD